MLSEHSAHEQGALRDLCSPDGCSVFRATNGKFQIGLKVEISRFMLVTVNSGDQCQIQTDLDFQVQQ